MFPNRQLPTPVFMSNLSHRKAMTCKQYQAKKPTDPNAQSLWSLSLRETYKV